MQTNAQKQEQIRQQIAELEKIESQLESEKTQIRDEELYNEDARPEMKKYDGEQVLAIIWGENINNILVEVAMSPLKQMRLAQMRDYMLTFFEVPEFIPRAPDQQYAQPPEQQVYSPPSMRSQDGLPFAPPYAPQERTNVPAQASAEDRGLEDEIGAVVDQMIEPDIGKQPGENDLDIISKKMKAIDSPDGLMNKKEEEPPKETGLKRFIPLFGGKKKPIEREVSNDHQPVSMG